MSAIQLATELLIYTFLLIFFTLVGIRFGKDSKKTPLPVGTLLLVKDDGDISVFLEIDEIGALVGKIGIEAPAHYRAGRGLAFKYGYLRSHSLCRCKLIFSGIRHEDCSCAYRGIKALNKTLLRADIQIRHKGCPALCAVGIFPELCSHGYRNIYVCMLFSAVAVEEFS